MFVQQSAVGTNSTQGGFIQISCLDIWLWCSRCLSICGTEAESYLSFQNLVLHQETANGSKLMVHNSRLSSPLFVRLQNVQARVRFKMSKSCPFPTASKPHASLGAKWRSTLLRLTNISINTNDGNSAACSQY